jgi:hypothetical protein
MRLGPKMAHPFFAGIPVKSNQFNYGPWTNYPALDINNDGIFPDHNNAQAISAINNWVLPTNVEVVPDLVPWNYGGMSFLDRVAYKEVKSRINYQSVIETANVEMAGLPIFNIGGAFDIQALNNIFPVTASTENLYYSEIKRTLPAGDFAGSITEFNQLLDIDNWTYSSVSTLTYSTLKTSYKHGSNSPIITHINIDIGSNGIKTSYGFRTYTRKLSLFNKEYSDRLKKTRQEALARDRQLAKINQQLISARFSQNSDLEAQRYRLDTNFASMRSKLADWSPVEVMVASAIPYIKEPIRDPKYQAEQNSEIAPKDSTGPSNAVKYSVPSDNDIGTTGIVADGLGDPATQMPFMSSRSRMKTLAQIYQISELDNFLQQDYGSKAAMSLDGLFSPVSFYPTDNLSTFSLSKYERTTCPVCKGTGQRTLDFKKFSSTANGSSTGTYKIPCNACCDPADKLHSRLYVNNFKKISTQALPPYIVTNDTDANAITNLKNLTSSDTYNGSNIPINLISLQPIVVPYSEFKNPNVQYYEGVHPEGYHGDLKVGTKTRIFKDRSRHSISIVARSAVPQKTLQIYNTIDDPKYITEYGAGGPKHNPAFFYKDIAAIKNLKEIDATNYAATDAENNQRFIGLRGPLVVHGWGYDTEGYPVPNAADEPLEIDQYNRPKRFKVKKTVGPGVEYKDLMVGDVFLFGNNELVKAKNLDMQSMPGYTAGTPTIITNTTTVQKVTYEDDMSADGGFDETYTGSVISKTQKYENSKWTEKRKLKEFYLNWAEHPENWPVGPVDLRWDEHRRVWTAQNPIPQYKMVYVTLEEDLLVGPNTTETYAAKGFLDDIEYANLPLDNGYRRMVFVRDRAAYTAPRGAKLLCRYDTDSGYYEPVSKPSFSVMGFIGQGSATISMSYIEGIKKGENAPTMQVTYDNPLGFEVSPDNEQKGIFAFMGGKWTLTATKE